MTGVGTLGISAKRRVGSGHGLIATSLGISAAFFSLTMVSSGRAQNRPWSIKDSVELVRFADPASDRWASTAQPVFSPGGEAFAIVSERGSLKCDCNIATLRIYRVRDVEAALEAGSKAPEPHFQDEFHTIAEDAGRALRRFEWVDDATAIFEAGARSSNPPNFFHDVYRLKLGRAVRLENLTTLNSKSELNPFVFRRVVGDDAVLTIETRFVRPSPPTYPFQFIDPHLREVFRAGLRVGSRQDGIASSEVILRRGNRRTVVVREATNPVPGVPHVLPARLLPGASTTVIGTTLATTRPSSWEGYDTITPYLGDGQFRTLNLRTGEQIPIHDAPYGTATAMGRRFQNGFSTPGGGFHMPPGILAAAGGQFILLNAGLPLEAGHPEHKQTAYILAFTAATRKIANLGPLENAVGPVSQAQLLENGHCLVITRVRPSGQPETQNFRSIAGVWREDRPCRQNPKPVLQVEIAQTINTPPRVVAKVGGREIELISPDSSLGNVAIAQRREFRWTEADGLEVAGQLTMPTVPSSRPVPLVIYTNWRGFEGFLPDGSVTQHNIQHLAAHGIAVLQVPILSGSRTTATNTPDEGPAMVRRIDAAVAALAADGMIDPTRVGAFGFSRGGFYARYAASFPGRVHLAAAITDDAQDHGFGVMLGALATNDRYFQQEVIGVLGGQPFWRDKQGWLAREYNLNLEKLRTPLLSVTRGDGAGAFGYTSETFAARMSINAPIEHATFPTASHSTHRPREREAWINLSLDWFRFWLQGVEDPAPAKRDMYDRWRSMRNNLSKTR